MSLDYDPRQLAIAFLNTHGKLFSTEKGYLRELIKSERKFAELLKQDPEELLKEAKFFGIR